jgi:hypothetical protein
MVEYNSTNLKTHTHTYTHAHIYIYIYIYIFPLPQLYKAILYSINKFMDHVLLDLPNLNSLRIFDVVG